ncbi:hypothetical protein ACNVED_12745 [Legionella sp. D16C41]|uniref:hypothetical protein n=1 Tax=Legionella sp. D16C41 TaxID=3402688 RepID=UPI003AF481F7
MLVDISQAKIIEKLNAYLTYNNSSLKLNPTGVCNGLAYVYAKYVFENKEQEFFKILEHISQGSKSKDFSDDEINYFIMQVMLAYLPQEYDQKLSQQSSGQILKVNDKPLNSIFNFSLVTTDQNWAEIFKSIALEKDEVMIITGVGHAVAVRKVNDHYLLYDSNNPSGLKELFNEEKLAIELHKQSLRYTSQNMALNIHILPHPEKQVKRSHPFPEPIHLYDSHIKSNEEATATATSSTGKIVNTLYYAAHSGDKDTLEYLLHFKWTSDNIKQATIVAIEANNINAIKPLVKQVEQRGFPDFHPWLLRLALISGRYEVCDTLLEDPAFKHYYTDRLNLNISSTNISFRKDLPFAIQAIDFAAQGGNEKLLKEVLNNAKNFSQLQNFLNAGSVDKTNCLYSVIDSTIKNTINSGSGECMTLLMEEIKPLQFSAEDKLDYLLLAIRQNKSQVAVALIKVIEMDEGPELAKKLFSTITIPDQAAKNMNLAFLRRLEKHGVKLSPTVKLIIQDREHKEVGLTGTASLLFSKFTGFFKTEVLSGTPPIPEIDREKLKMFKDELKSIKLEMKSSSDSGTYFHN